MIAWKRPEKIPFSLQSERVAAHLKQAADFYKEPITKRRQLKWRMNIDPLTRALEQIAVAFHHKCAYCETRVGRVSRGNVDHFRPVSGAKGFSEFSEDHYWWLMYEWRNLYLICDVCQRFKQNWFPVTGARCRIQSPYDEVLKEQSQLIDPCNENPDDHLFFEQSGLVKAISAKGETTIELLKLNRDELITNRKAAINEIKIVFKKRFSDAPALITEALQPYREVFAVNPRQQYAAAIRAEIIRSANVAKKGGDLLTSQFFVAKNSPLNVEQWAADASGLKSVVWQSLEKSELLKTSNKLITPPADYKTKLSKKKQEKISKIFLRRIEIVNFKAIRKLSIDLPDPFSNLESKGGLMQEPWLMLLGENGVGKSTVLQAIALTLCGSAYLKQLGLKPKDFLNDQAKSGYVRVYQHGSKVPFELTLTKRNLKCSHEVAPTYLLGYGSTRLSSNQLEAEPLRGTVKMQNLLEPDSALTDAYKWLVALHRKSINNKEQRKLFDWVGRALKDLLLLDGNEKITVERGVVKIRYTARRKEEFRYQSDGYKSVFMLAVDIMQALLKEKTTMETAQGIVLIDEIGTHLHPRWKMKVVRQLRSVFPKLQFIVTTHDPLCLRGLQKGEISVFTRNKGGAIQVNSDLPDPSGMNAEQLLASEFFGLSSTYDPDDEERFNEYYYLLSRKQLSTIQQDRKNELEKYVRQRQRVGSNPYEQRIHEVVSLEIAQTKFSAPKATVAVRKATLDKIQKLLS